MTNEPKIIINGHELSEAEAMTVRVAIGSFSMDLRENGLGEDETGKVMTRGYLAAIREINKRIRATEN